MLRLFCLAFLVAVANAADGCSSIAIGLPVSGDSFLVESAKCVLQPTRFNADQTLTGNFLFDTVNYDDSGETTNTMDVSYTVSRLSNGEHGYHVHDLGDIFTDDGMAAQYHFIGNPSGGRIEIGLLNDGTPVTVTAGDDSSGGFQDDQAALNGINDLLGRSMIIHGIEGNANTRAAQCVIGKTGENTGLLVEDRQPVTRAICNLKPTNYDEDYADIFGTVEFLVNIYSTPNQLVDIKTFITGLPTADTFGYTINTFGNMDSASGASTGNVFQGSGSTRGGVGYLGGDGFTFSTRQAGGNYYIHHYYTDAELQLNGPNGILGRSLVLREDDQDGPIIAQCVVGLEAEESGASAIPPPAPVDGTVPQVIKGAAFITDTNDASNAIAGYIQFTLLGEGYVDGPGVRVRWHIVGLEDGDHTMVINSYGVLGPDWDEDGSTSGPLFEGSWSGRADQDPVGTLNGGTKVTVTDGVTSGEYIDCCLALNGRNSIIGRMVVFKTVGDADYEAWGVIGRTAQHATNMDYDIPSTQSAHCLLQETEGNSAGGANPAGTIVFNYDGAGTLSVDLDLTGFTNSATHNWHVHDWGHVFDYNLGATTSGHFVGFNASRPTCPNEAGRLGGGTALSFTAGALSTTIEDYIAELGGINSIVGRALVIHTTTTTEKQAICVIGIQDETLVDPGNPCDGMDCNQANNGGDCIEEWEKGLGAFVCKCNEDYYGDNCETYDPCPTPADCPPPPDDTGVAASLIPSLVVATGSLLLALITLN